MLHACDFCTRVRWLAYSPLARRRCPAQVCIPAMARRVRVTCTCGSCLAVRVLAARDCMFTASRPSPIPTACDYVSLPTQSRRTLYSSCSHCARLRLARRRYSLRATTSRPSPMPCPCLSFCTLGELAPCAHVGAASHSRRT